MDKSKKSMMEGEEATEEGGVTITADDLAAMAFEEESETFFQN